MPKNDPQSTPKKVVSVRLDLLPRLIEKAEELKQNPNQLMNLCLEGALDAMDSDGFYEIPIVQLYRALKGKTSLSSKAVTALCSLIVPEIYQIEQHEKHFLLELINKHDGPLTASILKGYQHLAVKMNKDRIENEKEVNNLKKKRSAVAHRQLDAKA